MNPRTNLENAKHIKVELWENQRDLDQHLVDDIVTNQLRYYYDYKEFIFPSTLVIVKFKNGNYLIDGQHRFAALQILIQTYTIMVPVLRYDCDTKKQVDTLYSMINHINANNCMTENGQLVEEGHKLKQLHVQLKNSYGSKIFHTKNMKKPYINLKCLDDELKLQKWFDKKSVQEIMNEIKIHNDDYFKVVDKIDVKEIKDNGGFCLQYRDPKARWIRTLF